MGLKKETKAERQVKATGEGTDRAGRKSLELPGCLSEEEGWELAFLCGLNAVTQQDAYPLPRIDDSLNALSGNKFLSTLDPLSGYWLLGLDYDARISHLSATHGERSTWVVLEEPLLYLDDIIVIAPDFDTHLSQLEKVLNRLRQAGLRLKPSKCELLQPEVRYPGHIVSATGVATDPEKVPAVKEWPKPQGIKQQQAFLETVGYYRQYISGFATIAKPLHRLTSKEADWLWEKADRTFFELLQQKLVSASVLGYLDPSQTYILNTDTRGFGVGAVLSQKQEEVERVIAHYSKTLSSPERNYCVTRRELLAPVKAIKHFRPYFYCRKFRLQTDHAFLRWLCKRKESSNQVARRLEILAEFSYTLKLQAGVKHEKC